MYKAKRFFAVILMAITAVYATAQETAGAPATTDVMRSNGKIFVVMGVVVIIVAGLLLYVISVDRKISKLEKNN